MANDEQQQSRVQCHYDILGCAQDAEISVIKKSHRKLVLKFHPDKNLGDESAADKFILVQRAYEVLTGKLCVADARIRNQASSADRMIFRSAFPAIILSNIFLIMHFPFY